MSVYVTGDTHGGFQRLGMKYFPEQKKMNREDMVIIAGDFGGLWGGTPAEKYWLDWLEDKPFTTAFLDGNHENFAMLNALPERLWHGGRIHEVRPHVLHLMRGQVFDIEGYTFFTMGGASSHDIQDGILDPEEPGFEERYWRMRRARAMFRVKGVSWWTEELPSDEEYEEARKNLDAHDWAVDYILTHCAPTSITQKIIPHARADRLTDFLEEVKNRARYHYWLFGHLHDNQAVDKKHIPLSCFNIVSIKKSISQRRPRLSRGAAYPSLKLNRTSYMVGGSRKGKCGMFFRVSLCGVLYQGGYAGKEQL